VAAVTLQPPSASRVPDILRRTVPWARFMSILLFLGGGMMVVGGLVMGLGMGFAGAASGGDFGAAAAGGAIGLVYACAGLLNIVPAMFLWRFASRSSHYVAGPSDQRLESALDAQRSYWKFMGIFAIVGMALICVVFVVAIIGAIMVAGAR